MNSLHQLSIHYFIPRLWRNLPGPAAQPEVNQPIDDTELVSYTKRPRDLNKKLEGMGIPKKSEKAVQIKNWKRTLDNRGYAYAGRVRKLDEVAELNNKISGHRNAIEEYETEKV